MKITPRSLESVKRGHQFIAAETARAVQDASEFAGRFARDYVQQHPQFTPRTGALQAATKTKVVRTKGGRLLKISNRKPYAASIDRGAKAHVIEAKLASVLTFRGRGGQWVSKRRVNHPGNRPYKFLYRATTAAYRVLGTNLTQRLSAIARRF